MKKKKILIVYATAGIGHKKAADALKEAFDEIAPADAEVSIIDSLDYTNAFFKWSYLKAYLLMVNKLPLFWGLAYYLTDNFFLNFFVSVIRRISNSINAVKLVKYLIDMKPDVVISTHFFASEVIACLKRTGKLPNTSLITVVTDYRLHSWWIGRLTDLYVVGSEDARQDLLGWGTDPSRIKVLGIPVSPVFSKDLDKKALLNKFGLKEGIFTMLVVGGGYGVGPISGIVDVIKGISHPVQAIIVCGRNEELVKKLEAQRPSFKNEIKILGFVNNVYEYMTISDILISKSGGVTVAESMSKELPMVIISPIIGQETRNSGFLTKAEAGVKIDRISELKNVLERLMAHPEEVENIRRSIRKIRKPSACYDIAKLAMESAMGQDR